MSCWYICEFRTELNRLLHPARFLLSGIAAFIKRQLTHFLVQSRCSNRRNSGRQEHDDKFNNDAVEGGDCGPNLVVTQCSDNCTTNNPNSFDVVDHDDDDI
jgi:hypothetical protein